MAGRFTEEDLRACFDDGEPGLSRLVAHLTPVLHARIARLLLRRAQTPASGLHQEAQERIQDIFVILFERDAAVLRKWSPDQGMSLENYVGLVAERRMSTIFRDRDRLKRKARESSIDGGGLELRDPAQGPRSSAEGRQLLRLLLERLQSATSPSNWRIFQLRFIQELDVDEISDRTEMSREAIYASLSRMRRLARDLKQDIEGGSTQ